MSIDRARAFLANAELTERQKLIARQVLKEIDSRLRFLSDVGLDYLTLSRSAGTLSGGEAQRIRLATQIGSSTDGRALHPRRTLHRPAPARQRPPAQDAQGPARPGQHADRRRARRGDHARERLHRRRRPPARAYTAGEIVACGTPHGDHGEPPLHHRRVPLRPPQGARARRAAQAHGLHHRARRARPTTSKTSTCASRSAS